MSVAKVFNPKDLSHIKYHFYAIMVGLFFSMFSIIIEDIGITTFGTCGVARGSILEFLFITIIIAVYPYCVYSAVKSFMHKTRDTNTQESQKALYTCHIWNVIIFSLTWMPYIVIHFLTYAVKLDLTEHGWLRSVILTLVCSTAVLNSATRIYFDAPLRRVVRLILTCKACKSGGQSMSELERDDSLTETLKGVEKSNRLSVA